MAFITCEFFSEVLGICSSMNVILPQNCSAGQIGIKEKKGRAYPPVLYLLHGYSDNHSAWMRRTSIERYSSELGLAVIMPAVNLSYYTDMKNGDNYWTFISQELPKIVDNFFHVSKKKQDTFVAGLSMGGYGAFKLALTYPERYAAAGSFSGALDIYSVYKNTEEKEKQKKFFDSFGDSEELIGGPNDLYFLAEKLSKRNWGGLLKAKLPKFYQCCGTDDFLYEDNLRFRDFMHEHEFELMYEEAEGEDHNWEYWDKSAERFLSLIANML